MYLHGWQCSEIKLYVPHRRLTIKAIVINLIAQVLRLAVFTWSLVQSITMHLPDQYILGSILLVIGAVIAIISFLRDLKKAFSFPDWKVAIDQKGIYCCDETGEFRVEWHDVKRIILVHTKGSLLSMEVITNIGNHKRISFCLFDLFVSPVNELIRFYSCDKCKVIVERC